MLALPFHYSRKEHEAMTSSARIRRWLETAQQAPDVTHVVVVLDTFDGECYPVEVCKHQSCRAVAEDYNGKSMQCVMEVYDLSLDLEDQLNEIRAWHF